MKKSLIIIGSGGVIGQSLIENATVCEREFSLLGIQKRKREEDKRGEGIEYIYADITDKEKTHSLKAREDIKGCVLVVLAWKGNLRTAEGQAETNKAIIRSSCELARAIGAKKIVFISSAGAVYRGQEVGSEECVSDVEELSEYGRMKIWAERYLESFCRELQIKLVVLRVSSAFGKRHNMTQGVVGKWIEAIMKGDELELFNKKDSEINFISIDNVCHAIKKSAGSDIEGIYNIGSRRSQSLSEITKVIEEATGKKARMKEVGNNTLRLVRIDTDRWKRRTGEQYEGVSVEEVKKIIQERSG